MWNKTGAVVNILEKARNHFKEQLVENDDRTLAFDDIYTYYLKSRDEPFAMSKAYFEKCVNHLLKGYIAYTHVVSEKWLDDISNEDKSQTI
jgi:hypothetical protein